VQIVRVESWNYTLGRWWWAAAAWSPRSRPPNG
jgi:hypothetical protein